MTIEFTSAVPQFTVPDVVKTAEYYRDVLGFQIAGYWDGESASMEPAEPPVFGIVWRGKVEIFFSRADDSPVRTGRAKFALFTFASLAWTNSRRNCASVALKSSTDPKIEFTTNESWW